MNDKTNNSNMNNSNMNNSNMNNSNMNNPNMNNPNMNNSNMNNSNMNNSFDSQREMRGPSGVDAFLEHYIPLNSPTDPIRHQMPLNV